MEIDWKKLCLIGEIAFLMSLLTSYYSSLHNIDLAYNFKGLAKCDFVSKDECVDLRNLYIESCESLRRIVLIIVGLSILIGFTIHRL